MYCTRNFASKKSLKDAIAAGHLVTVFQPGLGGEPPADGRVYLEGPHYPQPHRWYAQATLKDGVVVAVK